MRFIICFIQASKGQGKIDNNSPNIQKKKLIKWQKGMLSIFFPQNSPLKPLKTEHFLFELFPFFPLFFSPPPSFIQQTRPDVSVHCRPGWRLVFIVIFLIYYLFSFYFVLCVFQLLSIGEAGLKVPHSCGGKKKKKVMCRFLFTRGSKWNESTSLSLLQQLWKVIPKHLGHQLNWSLSSGRPPWPDEPAVQPQPHPPKHSRSPNVSNSEHSALLFKRKTLKRINRLTLLILTCVSTDLWAERLWGLQHVEQLRVVDLQQHACDLACQAGVHVLDQWKQTLTYWRDT